MARALDNKPFVLEHGERFGKLTVLKRTEKKGDRPAKWWVGCECGHRFRVRAAHLRKGRVKSCPRCAV